MCKLTTLASGHTEDSAWLGCCEPGINNTDIGAESANSAQGAIQGHPRHFYADSQERRASGAIQGCVSGSSVIRWRSTSANPITGVEKAKKNRHDVSAARYRSRQLAPLHSIRRVPAARLALSGSVGEAGDASGQYGRCGQCGAGISGMSIYKSTGSCWLTVSLQ